MTNPEAAKIKQMRQFILDTLNRLYPAPLQVQSLYRVLCGFDENYEMSLLQKDIAYLKDKGYVVNVDDLLGGSVSFKKKCIKLSATGKEIADDIINDPAMEI